MRDLIEDLNPGGLRPQHRRDTLVGLAKDEAVPDGARTVDDARNRAKLGDEVAHLGDAGDVGTVVGGVRPGGTQTRNQGRGGLGRLGTTDEDKPRVRGVAGQVKRDQTPETAGTTRDEPGPVVVPTNRR